MVKIIHNISVIILRITDKLMSFLRYSCFYENKYGIKDFASQSFKLSDHNKVAIVELNPADVYLSFDGLKNQYTLIDKPISESPHVELIRLINMGEDISACDYVKRETNGFLDHRDKEFISEKIINYHLEKNKMCDISRQPIVYKLDNKYYVLDGKHRFASAFLSGEESVKCKEVSCKEIAEWKYLCKLYSIVKNKKVYSKQLDHIEKLMQL